jgi:hypothetical protein
VILATYMSFVEKYSLNLRKNCYFHVAVPVSVNQSWYRQRTFWSILSSCDALKQRNFFVHATSGNKDDDVQILTLAALTVFLYVRVSRYHIKFYL